MGVVLFVVRKWSDCAILVTAIVFLLQPVEWYHYIVSLYDPSHTLPDLGVGAMYQEVAAYTKGFGRIFLTPAGYAPCHNAEEVIAAIGYDAEHDTANPSGSVFCAHGAGFHVPWNEVKKHMHVEGWQPETAVREELPERATHSVMDEWIGVDEVDAILEKTFYANSGARTRRNGVVRRRRVESRSESVTRSFTPQPRKQEYLLVDGYNIIFAWDELKELARENMDAARGLS